MINYYYHLKIKKYAKVFAVILALILIPIAITHLVRFVTREERFTKIFTLPYPGENCRIITGPRYIEWTSVYYIFEVTSSDSDFMAWVDNSFNEQGISGEFISNEDYDMHSGTLAASGLRSFYEYFSNDMVPERFRPTTSQAYIYKFETPKGQDEQYEYTLIYYPSEHRVYYFYN